MLCRAKVFENLKYIGGPPSVQMQDIPSDAMSEREEDEDKRNKDVRISSEYSSVLLSFTDTKKAFLSIP